MTGDKARRQTFEDPQAGFTVAFPGKPTRTATRLGRTSNLAFTVTTATARFEVSVATDPDLSPHEAGEVLEGFRQAASFDAKVEREQSVTAGAVAGLELRTSGKGLDGKRYRRVQRLYVGQGRTWTVLVSVEGTGSLEAAGADAFLASFALR